MKNREFVISDLHLGHANILTFKRNDGTPLRDFKTLDDMHKAIINGWNKVVGPNDKTYVLGDVIMNKKGGAFELLNHMNGRKSLIRGNHDIFDVQEYLKYFYDIQGVKVKPKLGLVMTHVPVHEDCLTRPSWRINVHGHLHSNYITRTYCTKDDGEGYWGDYVTEKNEKYVNVCCEENNYTPIDLEDLYERTKHINVQEKKGVDNPV